MSLGVVLEWDSNIECQRDWGIMFYNVKILIDDLRFKFYIENLSKIIINYTRLKLLTWYLEVVNVRECLRWKPTRKVAKIRLIKLDDQL